MAFAALITYDKICTLEKFRCSFAHIASADAIIVLVWFFAVMLTVVVFASYFPYLPYIFWIYDD